MHFLSVLAIFKNETLGLKMWIDHYMWQGVEHFFMIDNGSTDEPLAILQPYIDRGLVTYEYRPEQHIQPKHYAHMFSVHDIASKSEWMLVCDLDEFAFGAVPGVTLATRLRHLDHAVDAVYVHWTMFSSAEFVPNIDPSLLDERTGHPLDIRVALTWRRPELDVDHKYMVRTRIVRDPAQVWIHCLLHHSPTDRILVDDEGMRMFHYTTQSRHFFETVKMVRGDADGNLPVTGRDWTYYDRLNKGMEVTDTLLCDMVLLAREGKERILPPLGGTIE